MSPRGLTAAAALILLAACGGSQAEPEHAASSPFLDSHESMFENGMDMVRDPDALDGSWLGAWQDELDNRVTHADVVALVTVRTLRTDVDLDRSETFRIIASVERAYLGEAGEELTLTVSENERGYGTVENNQRRLLDEQFIVFVKWQQTDEGVRARWHLSPATEAVAIETRRLLESRRQVRQNDGSRRTVVVHRN